MVRRIIGVAVIVLVVGSIIGTYEVYAQFVIQSQVSACPMIIAKVSYQNASGFGSVTHSSGGDSQSTFSAQLAIVPNATGKLELLFSSTNYNVTSSEFEGMIPV